MTQHFIGAIDGVIVTLSDSRTTYGPRQGEIDPPPPNDTVVKYATYPSDPQAWYEGALAAVVLVQGRANFTCREGDGTVSQGAQEREAAEIVTNFLSTRSGRFSSLQKLGDEIWQHIMNDHWYGCPGCRRLLSTSRVKDEPVCGYHGEVGFSLFVAGINGDEASEPRLYQRRLGHGRGVTGRIGWPYLDTVGHNGRAEGALLRGLPEEVSEYKDGLHRYWEMLVDRFNRTAVTAPCTEGPAGTAISTVGGTIRSVVVDPTTGLTVKAEQPAITAGCGKLTYDSPEPTDEERR